MRLSTFAAVFAAATGLFVLMNCAAPPPSSADGTRGDKTATDPSDVTGDGDAKTTVTNNGLPCDVNATLTSRCQACHGAETTAGASTPLTSWDDLTKDFRGKKVYELVKERIHAEKNPMPPSPRLQATELSAIDKWIEAGAPKNTSSCEGPAAPKGPEKLECEEGGKRTILEGTGDFVMAEGGELDQYVCFGVDVQRDQKHHLVGFGPKVDNAKILHHILVFQADKSVDPTPKACNPAASASWTMIGGWAPGGTNRVMPPEAGIPEESGTTHYVIQLHYNNALGLTGARDRSGMELCSTPKLRPNDAGIVAFGAMNLGPKKPINIPPRKTRHVVTCDYKWRHEPVTFFSAAPHMHKYGRELTSTTTSGRVLAENKSFDFEQQIGAKISSNIKTDETVRTTCVWSNPDDKSVTFGEGTDDEMCFNFLAYYPRVKGILSWAQPSVLSNCTEVE